MFVPSYNKPESPGIHMGFDNTVALRYVVAPGETFEAAATGVVDLLREAESRFPGWPRVFYIDIAGHEGDAAGFDPDFYEFQQEFFFSVVAPFVTAAELPLTGGIVNPETQRNDVPDALRIDADARPHSGQVIPDHGSEPPASDSA